MENNINVFSDATTIVIDRCSINLEVEGHDNSGTVFIDVGTQRPERLPEGQQTTLSMRVPRNAGVRVGRMDKDARFERLAVVEIERASGDLDLREIGERCVVGKVEGDTSVRDIANLRLERVSGDLYLETVTGEVDIERVEGDVELRGFFNSFAPLRVSGDMILDAAFAPGQEYHFIVEGDVDVHWPTVADLVVQARVEGDVSGLPATEPSVRYGATWGAGASRLTLEIDGDLKIRDPGAGPAAGARQDPTT